MQSNALQSYSYHRPYRFHSSLGSIILSLLGLRSRSVGKDCALKPGKPTGSETNLRTVREMPVRGSVQQRPRAARAPSLSVGIDEMSVTGSIFIPPGGTEWLEQLALNTGSHRHCGTHPELDTLRQTHPRPHYLFTAPIQTANVLLLNNVRRAKPATPKTFLVIRTYIPRCREK